ncbi:hypothetical protein GCM10027418_28730 [Mariniluteicoccus endophyticus]
MHVAQPTGLEGVRGVVEAALALDGARPSESRGLSLKVDRRDDGRYLVTLEAEPVFVVGDDSFDADLLMALSLVGEGIRGTPVPRPSELTRVEWEASARAVGAPATRRFEC